MTYTTFLVLATTSLLGAIAGVLGCFAVLRGRALVGDVLAHAALPGVCLAFLVIGGRELAALLMGALVAGLAAMALITLIRGHLPTKDDAALGIVLSVFFGLGVVLLSFIQKWPELGERAGLNHFLFGQAAGVGRSDLLLVLTLSVVAVAAVVLLFKELLLACFDPTFARIQGWPVNVIDALLFGLIAVVTVLGLPVVGVVLMAALLIIPPAAARFWTDRLQPMLVSAGVFGALSGILGTASSAGWIPIFSLHVDEELRLPTGPMIILYATALFLISMFFAPKKGLISRSARLVALRFRTGLEHLLREMYEITEGQLPHIVPVPFEELRERLRWSSTLLSAVCRFAAWRGWVRTEDGRIVLLPAGLVEARRVVRAHRLWELFLVEKAGIAPDHVHRDADEMEHFLPPDYLAELEKQLALPEDPRKTDQVLPSSPH